jgi:hypothetical protein
MKRVAVCHAGTPLKRADQRLCRIRLKKVLAYFTAASCWGMVTECHQILPHIFTFSAMRPAVNQGGHGQSL